MSPNRRSFLQASAGLAFLNSLPPVRAADAEPGVVKLESGIEPLVRLLEDTPRAQLLEEVGSRIKKGLPYKDVLTALLLAGVRNIQPRPNVGFKFHAVLVVNSAHQAALAAPDSERWLPLFWALDNFKSAQAANDKESGWRMKPVDESRVPKPEKARSEFIKAMDAWNVENADVAAAGLARCEGPGEAFDLFAKYGSRDFRDIGHKAIYVANAFRTLETIGWQHAEPVLRSLAYALMKYDGPNPAQTPQDSDKPGIRNAETAAKMEYHAKVPESPKLTQDFLRLARGASEADLCELVSTMLSARTPPRTVWSALLLAGGELLMRQPGIVALHSLTSLNALRYAAARTGDKTLQILLLLQATSFVPLFRDAMKARGKVSDAKIDELDFYKPLGVTVQAPFQELSKDKNKAARLALNFLAQKPNGSKELTDEARRLIFLKGTDSHDYKFSSAVIEDAAAVAPEWRDHFLAASLYWMKGSDAPDSPLVARTRAALA